MQAITSKSTKAEILQAYQALKAQPTTWQDAATLVANTAQMVGRETFALVRDTYNAGRIARQWVSTVVDELSRPVLKQRMSVNN